MIGNKYLRPSLQPNINFHLHRSGEHLMGSQTMRVRLLKLMGFKVMTVKLQLASQLLVHPRKLREYLQEQYKEASMAPKELK